ncbi:AlpA family phage regulatory protein [Pseudoxanthomonas sp. JBR18]|uniref:helix-turn-helix transcriptional regulator n=1 Tax=Pseudoxanthomonas sp. JBR18 TaxID=2969308 RepID=UPI002305DCAD|nr:AlpA family phage regulatory protein [Pseudoxanthomonas sp. JBR18]WCE03557.1 AlpA family phage regulatory protein [Pseudoxanthomonas sp. JBR18]
MHQILLRNCAVPTPTTEGSVAPVPLHQTGPASPTKGSLRTCAAGLSHFKEAMTTQTQTTLSYHFMRLPEVIATVGVSKSTLYAWTAAGKFPKPVQFPGGNIAAWVSTEVAAWMGAAVTARDAGHSLAA